MTSVVAINEYAAMVAEEALERDCKVLRAEREALEQRGVQIRFRADGWLLSGPACGLQIVYSPLDEFSYWTPDSRPDSCKENSILVGYLKTMNLFERSLFFWELLCAGETQSDTAGLGASWQGSTCPVSARQSKATQGNQ